MARPLKQGLHYFNIDCDFEDNVEFIKAKYGLEGLGIIVEIWRKIYKINGYFCEWSDRSAHIFAGTNSIDIKRLKMIVDDCLKEGIFSLEKWSAYEILTSHGIQKRYLKIVTEAKRKVTTIEPKYALLAELTPSKPEFPPEETPLTPEETPKFPEESTQKKRKESKVKESISPKVPEINKSNSPAPPPGDTGGKKVKDKEKQPRDYWQKFVDTWDQFYKSSFNGESPSYSGKTQNVKLLGEIYDRLKKRADLKGRVWSESYSAEALVFFLTLAFEDNWLKAHFLLSNLVDHYDSIFARAAKKTASKASEKPSGYDQELRYLVERFKEPDFDIRVIDPELYDKMVARETLPLNFLAQFAGETIQEQKIAAVTHWLKLQTQNI